MTTTNRQPGDGTAGILLVAALLFVADLFLGWQRVGVWVAGTVDLDATRIGWSGWGLVAGVLALVIAALAGTALRGGAGRPGVTLAVAVGLLVATGLHFPGAGPGANVTMPMMSAHAGAARWPAWVGLGLAALIVVVALMAFLASARGTARPAAAAP